MLDLVKEEWNAAQKSLSGESKLIAGDDYELRIVAPVDLAAGDAKLQNVSVSPEDQTAGVKISAERSKPTSLLRVKITSPTSRTVHWTVPFGN
jgi:hypothetical protein